MQHKNNTIPNCHLISRRNNWCCWLSIRHSTNTDILKGYVC